MNDLETMSRRLEAHSPAVRAAALEILDEISRPLTVRELERALSEAGVVKSQRVKLAGALKGLAVIALIGARTDNGRN